MDIKLNYIEKGSGFPLILLHGNGESLEYFCNQMDYFSNSFRVIAVDTRGHGRSPRGSGEFSIRRFADDLADFMDEHGIFKANILGFSDGGNIALCFALKYRDRVEKLILNGANLFSSGVKTSVQLPIIIGYRVARLFANKNENAKRNAEMLGLMVNDPALTSATISVITVPTLVIAGTNDMIKESHTKLIAKSLPNAELAFIEGDHFIAAKNSPAFNKVVFDFLKK